VRYLSSNPQLLLLIISDRFRWVFCQLDRLRRCFPPSIRRILNELPATLDETYERTLQEIPKDKKEHAYRLFQCLVAAIRPLHVEELAELFAIEIDQGSAPNINEGWRPENPEEAILSPCSTLIAIIDDDQGSKIVQFSHFSVKEFLTSDRLRISEVGSIHHYHIPLEGAHTILARACLMVLLQLDEGIDKERLAGFPLAFYAAQYWFVHAKHEGVSWQVQDAMRRLFEPDNPYLAAWIWIHDVDDDWKKPSIDMVADRPSRPKATALYYAVSCGLCGLAEYLISTHGEDVNAKCGDSGSPLHAASFRGHLDAVSLLIDYGADMDMTDEDGCRPLCRAFAGQHVDAMQLLLERGASIDMWCNAGLPIHYASRAGRADVIRLFLQHNANVNATDHRNYTPLHWASEMGYTVVVPILLENGADINGVSDDGTTLHIASRDGQLEFVRLLLERGADLNIRGPNGQTTFQVAIEQGHTEIAKLLLEHGANEE
jgi:ankyrin repeat protein